ncbi:MAG: hypothetical protein WCI67_21665 [Chloroflexales bacterium]
MARRKPNRRLFVTTFNTALATAAATATAAGWVAFGVADTSSAAARPAQAVVQAAPAIQPSSPARPRRRLGHREWWQFDFGSSSGSITSTRSSR